ncbi:MAG: N-acetyl sugar amidotransferase, partial [Candidatus Vecturithrix sp.]|nr:N-acetyl sugar amidotransferase [Candidatus Vecturithrix sp.]
NLKAIHKIYGEHPLADYRTISFFEYYIWYPFVKKMRTVRPLNYMAYSKEGAIEELERTVGYRTYGRKHGESQFTKFFQNYYLPKKFGYDKRRPHLSSLIVSGQLSRQQALEYLGEPLYDADELESDLAYFCKKLRISRIQFEELMNAKVHRYSDFPTWAGRYRILKFIQGIWAGVTGRRIKVYS